MKQVSTLRPLILLALAAGWVLVSAMAGLGPQAAAEETSPATEKTEPAGDSQTLEAKAQRQMAVLEETMDRLARLLEIDEPENAVRLRDAYSRARESFLSENMDRIVALLKGQKLEQAIDEHGSVSINLDGLLKILTGGELDPEAIKKEIERLKAIAKDLAELEKRERELQAASDQMAAAAGEAKAGEAKEGEAKPGEGKPGEGEPSEGDPGEEEPKEQAPADADAAKSEQDKTKKATDELAEKMEKGGADGQPTPGTEDAKGASGDMGEASESLSQSSPSGAAGKQKEAADKLAEAQKKVQEQIKKLENQLQQEMLADLQARFKAMLVEQKRLTTATEVTHARLGPPEQRNLERKDTVEIGKLAKGEGGLEVQAEESRVEIEEEGKSVVFPKVLEMLVIYLVESRERLEEHDTGEPTHAAQKESEQILEEMIAALDKEMEYRESKGCGT